jgi:hypothetical protein
MVACTQIARILLCFKLFVNDSHRFGGFKSLCFVRGFLFTFFVRDFGLLAGLNPRRYNIWRF